MGSFTIDPGWVQGKGLGIGSDHLNTKTAALVLLSTIETDNPSFLALHPSADSITRPAIQRVESDDSASAFTIAEDGTLNLINQQPSHGAAPCFVSVEPHGQFSTAKGSRPRHVSSHPSGNCVDLINQDAGTITAFIWDDELGLLSERPDGCHRAC